MLRAFLIGVATVTLFLAGSILGLLTEGDPPSPHVRLPDRGSTLTASPLRHLDEAVAWVVGIQRANIAAYLRSREQVERQNAETVRESPAPAQRAVSAPPEESGGWTAWDSTLACIRAHESDSAGGYSAQNPISTASGAYQVLDTTWDGYAGYPTAADAPPEIQDQWAIEALNSAGTQPWAGSGC